MGRFDNFAFGIDISRYQPTVLWDKVAPNIDFVIAKCGEGATWEDPKFAEHCQNAYDNDLPFLAYFWFDPNLYPQAGEGNAKAMSWQDDPQVKNLIHCLKNKKFYGIAIDIEQWWVSYTEYYEYLNKKRAKADVRVVSPYWICLGAELFIGRVKDWLASIGRADVPVGIYSAKWFIDSYTKHNSGKSSLYDLLAKQDKVNFVWSAIYPAAGGAVFVDDWQDKEVYYPGDVNDGYFQLNGRADFWQFSGDKYRLPGVYGSTGDLSALDLNLYLGTKEQMWQWLNFTPKDTTPADPPVIPGDDDDEPPVVVPTDPTEFQAAVLALLTEIRDNQSKPRKITME